MKNNSGTRDGIGPELAAGDSPLNRLSHARREVLDVLIRQPEPCTAHHIARSLHQHHNTIREHLDGLRRIGMVVRIKGPAEGRGRPPWFYQATEKAKDHAGSSDYAGLASALAAHIARTSDDTVSAAIEAGRHWGASLTTGEDNSNVPPVARVLTLLDDLGYAPELCESAGTTGEAELRLQRCPLLAAANENQEVVCGVHQGLIEGALQVHGTTGIEVELLPFAEPGACTLHLRHAESTAV